MMLKKQLSELPSQKYILWLLGRFNTLMHYSNTVDINYRKCAQYRAATGLYMMLMRLFCEHLEPHCNETDKKALWKPFRYVSSALKIWNVATGSVFVERNVNHRDMMVYLVEQFEETLKGALPFTEEHFEATFGQVVKTRERIRQKITAGKSEEDRYREQKIAKRGKIFKGDFSEKSASSQTGITLYFHAWDGKQR